MNVGPATARKWRISDDQLTYTFHIRPDAHWSNGDTVTAGDFIYAWRRALMPDFAADYTQLLWCIDGAQAFFKWRQQQIDSYGADGASRGTSAAKRLVDQAMRRFDQTVAVHAVDDRTLIVTLARPTPYFLQLCAFTTFAPVHARSVQEQVSINVDTGMLVQDPYWTRADRLICNGAYVLKRRRFKRDLLMVANDHYWNRAAVGNRSILERIVNDPQMQLLLYEAGEVDWLPSIPTGL